MPFKKLFRKTATAIAGPAAKATGAAKAAEVAAPPPPPAGRRRRGFSMLANVVAPTARVTRSVVDAIKEAKGLKKGGMVKKSSDSMGRAVKRKTADVKGRAMKKGK